MADIQIRHSGLPDHRTFLMNTIVFQGVSMSYFTRKPKKHSTFVSPCSSFIGRANLGFSYEFASASGMRHFPLLSKLLFPAVRLG